MREEEDYEELVARFRVTAAGGCEEEEIGGGRGCLAFQISKFVIQFGTCGGIHWGWWLSYPETLPVVCWTREVLIFKGMCVAMVDSICLENIREWWTNSKLLRFLRDYRVGF